MFDAFMRMGPDELGEEMVAAAALIPGCFDALRDRAVASNVWYTRISDQLVADLVRET